MQKGESQSSLIELSERCAPLILKQFPQRCLSAENYSIHLKENIIRILLEDLPVQDRRTKQILNTCSGYALRIEGVLHLKILGKLHVLEAMLHSVLLRVGNSDDFALWRNDARMTALLAENSMVFPYEKGYHKISIYNKPESGLKYLCFLMGDGYTPYFMLNEDVIDHLLGLLMSDETYGDSCGIGRKNFPDIHWKELPDILGSSGAQHQADCN